MIKRLAGFLIMIEIAHSKNLKFEAWINLSRTGPLKAGDKRLNRKWIKLNKRDIPIYVGFALYRVGTSSKTDLGWASSNANLAYQYVTATQLGYDGYALFRYQWVEKGIAVEELNNLKVY